MRYCSSCGNRIEDNAKFCSVCGAKTGNKNGESSFQTKVEDFISNFTNTANTTADYSTDDINKNRHMAVLAYLNLLFLVPLLLAKDSPFARYHVNQGILLFAVQTIGIAATQIPYAGWAAAAVVNILTTALLIIGIVNAIKGEAKELPLIGRFRILK